MNRVILGLVVVMALTIPVWANEITGKVVGVADGDTITILTSAKQQIRVRLYGVDCPEKQQAFGQKAKQATSDLVFGKEVVVEEKDHDRYGRLVGVVRCERLVLNARLLHLGLAWYYDRYCQDCSLCLAWRALEQEARDQGQGLWGDGNPVPPWDFRKQKKPKTSH